MYEMRSPRCHASFRRPVSRCPSAFLGHGQSLDLANLAGCWVKSPSVATDPAIVLATIPRVYDIAVIHRRDAVKPLRLSVNSVLAAVAIIAIDCMMVRGVISDIAPPPVPQASSRFTMISGPPKRLRTPAKTAKTKDGS
jgi:hypothetical protein